MRCLLPWKEQLSLMLAAALAYIFFEFSLNAYETFFDNNVLLLDEGLK